MGSTIKAAVFNIERYHIHDGNGIRTIIFLKGCPLRCPWCSNPESWHSKAELAINYNFCVGCGLCLSACPYEAIKIVGNKAVTIRDRCIGCGECLDSCMHDARVLYGKEMSVEDVMLEVRKDMPFYRRSRGGVTFSGGEPCMHAEFVKGSMEICLLERIDTAIETCGAVPFEKLLLATELADEILFDIKTLESDIFSNFSDIPLNEVLSNLEKIVGLGKNVRIRSPIIPDYNYSKKFVRQIAKLAKRLDIKKVDLLPFHQLGSYKYKSLDRHYSLAHVNALTKQDLEELRIIVEAAGLKCVIGG